MLKIFCVYFDRRPVWKSDAVEPIQAGKTRTGFDLGMLADDTGDNISAENVRYGEMTAWYWVWKNYLPAHPELTHVGFSHYRRFLDVANFGGGRTKRTTYRRFRRIFARAYNAESLAAAIGNADLVMRGPKDTGFPTLREEYLDSHPENIADFDHFLTLLAERHPDRQATINAVLNSGRLAMELQFVMTRELFTDFMDWTFSLCRAFESRWSWTGASDGGQARAPAFLIERLFLVWLALKHEERPLKVRELQLVKFTQRPWWWHLLKPVRALLPKSLNDRLHNRFK